jgi:hypothetical protein
VAAVSCTGDAKFSVLEVCRAAVRLVRASNACVTWTSTVFTSPAPTSWLLEPRSMTSVLAALAVMTWSLLNRFSLSSTDMGFPPYRRPGQRSARATSCRMGF